MAKRGAPPAPTLGRRSSVRRPKLAVLVFCEGKNTEPQYLTSFANFFGNNLVKIGVVAPAGAPMTIIGRATEAKIRSSRSKDSFTSHDQVWALFDRDEHQNVNDAISIARDRGIKVGFSNPCFEVWLLLHHGNYDADEHRKITQKRYEALDAKFDANGSKSIDMERLIEGYPDACRRAKQMRERREAEGALKGAPYTDVDLLTELIRENGRIK